MNFLYNHFAMVFLFLIKFNKYFNELFGFFLFFFVIASMWIPSFSYLSKKMRERKREKEIRDIGGGMQTSIFSQNICLLFCVCMCVYL